MIKYSLCYILALLAFPCAAMENADPLVWTNKVEQLAWQHHEEDQYSQKLKFKSWLGVDKHKLKLSHKAERSQGRSEEAHSQLSYLRAWTSNWNWQLGLAHDWLAQEQANSLVIGVDGLAPYFWHSELSLALKPGGEQALKWEADNKWPLSQRWLILPELELEAERGRPQQGFSQLAFALKLAYKINPQLMPYLGWESEHRLGQFRRQARNEGLDSSRDTWQLGLKFWF